MIAFIVLAVVLAVFVLLVVAWRKAFSETVKEFVGWDLGWVDLFFCVILATFGLFTVFPFLWLSRWLARHGVTPDRIVRKLDKPKRDKR